jgi:hypothetical protein
MPGRGFIIPDDMLPHRERLSDEERKQFVRIWTKLTLKSRSAWASFSAAFCCLLLLLALLIPPWNLDGGPRYFMFCWEPLMSFTIALYFAYRCTKKEIVRMVSKHLGFSSEEEI